MENGHQSKDCTSQKTCKSCNELHPTCLHNIYDRSNSKPKSVSDSCPDKSDVSHSVKPSPVTTKSDEIKPDVKVKKSFNTSCSNSINMCIVPVVVRHKNSKFDFKTFALLDSCSQGTFIHQDLLNELSVPSIETKLTVSTLNGLETCLI